MHTLAMEKQGSGSSSSELQCVGRLEIESPKPVGFLCGSIPITTDEAFHDYTSAALVPSSDTVKAPRYQMIPTETDLNSLPTLSCIPDKVIPVTPVELRSREEAPSQGSHITSSLTRKGEALAVSGLAEYGDEIDVIAPADILKQIFKIPYSKSRVSIAVRRVGQTLVLNSGPDIEEGEKLIRRQHRQPKCVDQSLFLNFAMHSVRMEACDCPPSHNSSSNENYGSSIYSKQYMPNEVPLGSSNHGKQGHASFRADADLCEDEADVHGQGFPQDEKGKFVLGKKNKRNKGRETVKKVAEVKEKTRGPVQESEKYRKTGDDGFLRVLFWQFHNFRMLLGSDLLIFSNEKYVAVSLHLWDVSRKVTPLTWLEAWLDNYMANVPELAICYHQDGVVQGYELLKTDDIFLLKGISDDGTPAFYPHVVQQNGLSVMRFLQENCKQEPGAYWLYKSAGEDVIQLFDLSVIPKNHTADSCHDSSSSLPSLIYRGRSDSILALGTLLYRIAHRLSLSMSSDKRARCARLFQKCLTFLDEPDHLVVRALAHEQFARLLLTYNDELELTSDMLPVESEVKIADAEEESYEFISGMSASHVQDIIYPPIMAVEEPNNLVCLESNQENSAEVSTDPSMPPPGMPIVSDREADENLSRSGDSEFAIHSSSESEDHAVQTVADPLASKLAAIHHVSQAIKSLRWTRQLQSTRPEVNHESESENSQPPQMDFSICACGDSDCIEVCDIREWLPTSKLDDKLWKLVLLLGESYLALGEAYKDSSQLYQALKVIELACLVYGSMPQDNKFISSMVGSSLPKVQVSDISEKAKPVLGERCFKYDDLSSNYLFWAKAWTLVGDVFIEFYLIKGQEVSKQEERKGFSKDLKMSSEVLKEVERLKKKMGQFNKNCSSCSLVNCSCRSDRASSGSSASCSNRGSRSSGHVKKQSKKSRGKSSMSSRATDLHKNAPDKKEHIGECNKHQKHGFNNGNMTAGSIEEAATTCERVDGSLAKDNSGPKEESAVKRGGIFKYLRGSTTGDLDHTLCVALSCYGEVEKVMSELPASSAELQSLLKKKGWVCNELGRNRLERKELAKAESAFVEAIVAFRQVEDHTNVILINCNLGHGRRALAEDIVSKIESLKEHAAFQNAYVQALEAAKQRYSEALRYYGAAKTELNALAEKPGPVPSDLKNEVNTQFAHTYLKLGMLLARENTVAEVYENGVPEECSSPNTVRHTISANDAIREALSLYESLGELRKQEAAYAYYQLACYQRDCCLRFLESDDIKRNLGKGESSVVQRMKQYFSLAERNWKKSMDFYGPKTHPVMFLMILLDRSELSFSLSSPLYSNTLLESALTIMFEGRDVSENTPLLVKNPEISTKFWSQLQKLLKTMVAMARSTKTSKPAMNPQHASSSKSADVKKLSELYKISLKSSGFSQLHVMHSLWKS